MGDLLEELRRQAGQIADQARETLSAWVQGDADLERLMAEGRDRIEHVAEDVRYHVDRQVGRLLSDHPDLYAELHRGMRRLRRTARKVAEDLGLR